MTTKKTLYSAAFAIAALRVAAAFAPFRQPAVGRPPSSLSMALDYAMKARLDGIRRSYQALTERLGDPDVISDSNLLRQVMRDRSQSEEVVAAFDEYCRLEEELAGAVELFQEAGDDAEMREMARAEMKTIEPAIEDLDGRIKVLMLPKDPNDDRNCMLEIRAGTGGSEANIFAGDLLDVYRKFMSNEGWRVTTMDSSPGDDGGYKNVVLEVKGESVYSKLKWEAGVHRVQRVPATESQGRVHTSTATVAIMPECDEVDIKINPKDIEIEKQEAEQRAARGDQIGTGGRSEKIRTYNWKDSRVSDHRLGQNFPLQGFLGGAGVGAIIDGLIAQDQERKLRQLSEEAEL